MTNKLLLTIGAICGLISFNASAGESYSAKASAKCPVDDCPDVGGSVSFGYETDYILYGVRQARDSVWTDVNYTYDRLPLPITIGVWHLTSLASGGANFDETDLYATVEMPKKFFGFTTSFGYVHRFFPTTRAPSGFGTVGDSRAEFWGQIERELLWGVNAFYRRAYDYQVPSAFAPAVGNNMDEGAWMHTLGLEKGFDITDTVGLALSGGVLYSDNYWPAVLTAANGSPIDRARSTGWNSYYLRAAFPIALNCRAVLTPYIGYNGSPDTWIADGVDLGPGSNANDILHGGVNIRVNF